MYVELFRWLAAAVILICCSFFAHGQDNQAFAIDSIKRGIPTQAPPDQVKAYSELSWYYRNFDVDSAVYFARTALDYAQEVNVDSTLAAAYNSLANSFESKGLIDSAEFYYLASLERRISAGDSLRLAMTMNNLGILYDEKGMFSTSLEYYFQSLTLFEEHTKDPFQIAMVLGNIGIVYKKQKAFDQVLDYYERALKIYMDLDSKFGQVVTEGNIGSVLISLARYNESIEFSSKALTGYQELGYLRYVPYMEHNIAVANDSLDNLDNAGILYQKAVKGHQNFKNTYELANTYTALAGNYLKREESANAYQTALKAVAQARLAKATEFEVNALKFLAEASAALGKYKEAFNAYKASASGKDSLFEENKTRQIFELREQYESDKREQRIALQGASLEAQEARLERNQISMIALIVATGLLVAVLLLLRVRSQKEKALIKREGELRLREAEVNAVINSQEKERNRFARDLHDGFGQMISVLKLNLGLLKEVDSRDLGKREEIFDSGERVINEMYDELRNICFDLMPQTLVKQGLTAALQEFGSRIGENTGTRCEVMVFDDGQRPSELVEVALFRITQEWANNVLKYASASELGIQVTQEATELTLTIEDDGNGFDPQVFYQGKGNGWRNIQSRLNQVKGNFDLDSRLGVKGSMVTVNVGLEKLQNVPTGTEKEIAS